MTISIRRALCAAGAGIFLAASALSLSAQEAPVVDEAGPVRAALVQRVAEAWSIDPALVEVEVSGVIPEGVDSVTAAESSPAKWIATFHVGDRAIRRFANVGHSAVVEIAATSLRRGAVIDSVSIDRAQRILPGPPKVAEPTALGMVAERSIDAGQLLRHPAVRPPYVIRGGEQVEAVLQQGAVTMTVLGEALGSARVGEVIQVRLVSGIRRRARATRQGVVTLIPGGK